jgi:hypothetical protein
MTANDILRAWNNQADAPNQWYDLLEIEAHHGEEGVYLRIFREVKT